MVSYSSDGWTPCHEGVAAVATSADGSIYIGSNEERVVPCNNIALSNIVQTPTLTPEYTPTSTSNSPFVFAVSPISSEVESPETAEFFELLNWPNKNYGQQEQNYQFGSSPIALPPRLTLGYPGYDFNAPSWPPAYENYNAQSYRPQQQAIKDYGVGQNLSVLNPTNTRSPLGYYSGSCLSPSNPAPMFIQRPMAVSNPIPAHNQLGNVHSTPGSRPTSGYTTGYYDFNPPSWTPSYGTYNAPPAYRPQQQPIKTEEYFAQYPPYQTPKPIVKTIKSPRMSSARKTSRSCSNCSTKDTKLWRRNPQGESVCNACGLYIKLHKRVRPQHLIKDTVQIRKRKTKSVEKPKTTSGSNQRPKTETTRNCGT